MKTYTIKYPIVDDNKTNYLFEMCGLSKDTYKSDLLLLLFTEKGERYYMPDYGTNLLRYIFEPNDDATRNDIVDDLKRTVSKYMPNITIDSVDINVSNEDESTLIDRGEVILDVKFTYNEDTYSEQSEISIKF